MYKKLFELSGLSNKEIVKRLGIDYTRKKQFENATKVIDVDKFVLFAKQLELTSDVVSEMVRSEIINKYKN